MPEHHAPKGVRIRLLATALLSAVLWAGAISQSASSSVLFGGKPTLALQASKTSITIPCPPGTRSISNSCPTDADLLIRLTSTGRDFGKQTRFVYSVGVGRIIGAGASVIWDLNQVFPGNYTATVEVRDNKKRPAVSSVTVRLANCTDCVHHHEGFCLPFSVMCYDEVKAGTPITCKVVIPRSSDFKYLWSVHGYSGEDLSGRLSSRDTYVSIPTESLAGQTVHVRVEVKGLDPACSSTASSQTKVRP